MNRDARSPFRQFQRDATANAPGATCDQRILSLERHMHLQCLRHSMLVLWPAMVNCSAGGLSFSDFGKERETVYWPYWLAGKEESPIRSCGVVRTLLSPPLTLLVKAE